MEKGLHARTTRNYDSLKRSFNDFSTYLISPFNYENHAFYVIKYLIFVLFFTRF